MSQTGQHPLRLLGVAALAAAALTACGGQVSGTPEPAKPSTTTNPSGQVSATGAPKLRFRPVLDSAQSPSSEKGQLTDPTKATTPEQQQLIEEQRESRQNTSPPALGDQSLAQYQCPAVDALSGHDDPALPLITCDQDNAVKYLLGPAFLDNTHIVESTAEATTTGAGHVISVRFDDQGSKVWADYTTKNLEKQVALVFNTTVLSAPTIAGPITGGTAQISGNFTRPTAQRLADQIAGR
jgi:preprotein translocase subunit SecD